MSWNWNYEDLDAPNTPEIPGVSGLTLVGQGGMGKVYRGVDDLGRAVAVKLLQDPSPKARQRFEREAKLLARIRSPLVVTIHTWGATERFAYFVCELVEGQDLADAARVRDYAGRLALVDQLFAATAAAHAAGIVHRDLKPSNALVDDEGHLRLIDFGLSLGEDQERLTQTGAFVGTLAYAPPERINGTDSGPRGDVWSLCAIAHEVLSGERAYPCASLAEFGRRVSELPPTARQVPELPAAAVAVLERGLAVRAEERYADADVLRSAFRAASGLDVAPRTSRSLSLPAALLLCLAAGLFAWRGAGPGGASSSPSRAPSAAGSPSSGSPSAGSPGSGSPSSGSPRPGPSPSQPRSSPSPGATSLETVSLAEARALAEAGEWEQLLERCPRPPAPGELRELWSAAYVFAGRGELPERQALARLLAALPLFAEQEGVLPLALRQPQQLRRVSALLDQIGAPQLVQREARRRARRVVAAGILRAARYPRFLERYRAGELRATLEDPLLRDPGWAKVLVLWLELGTPTGDLGVWLRRPGQLPPRGAWEDAPPELIEVSQRLRVARAMVTHGPIPPLEEARVAGSSLRRSPRTCHGRLDGLALRGALRAFRYHTSQAFRAGRSEEARRIGAEALACVAELEQHHPFRLPDQFVQVSILITLGDLLEAERVLASAAKDTIILKGELDLLRGRTDTFPRRWLTPSSAPGAREGVRARLSAHAQLLSGAMSAEQAEAALSTFASAPDLDPYEPFWLEWRTKEGFAAVLGGGWWPGQK